MDKRIKNSHDIATGLCTLVIVEANLEDTGMYHVKASNKFGITKASVRVSVVEETSSSSEYESSEESSESSSEVSTSSDSESSNDSDVEAAAAIQCKLPELVVETDEINATKGENVKVACKISGIMFYNYQYRVIYIVEIHCTIVFDQNYKCMQYLYLRYTCSGNQVEQRWRISERR